MFERRDLLYIHLHLLLDCVHKYTDIYNDIGLLALKSVMVVERDLLHIHLHIQLLLNCIHK